MSIVIESSTTPADLLTPSEAHNLAGVTRAEWSHAKKYNPTEFPRNYTGANNKYGRYSAAEVTAFFNKYNKKGD